MKIKWAILNIRNAGQVWMLCTHQTFIYSLPYSFIYSFHSNFWYYLPTECFHGCQNKYLWPHSYNYGTFYIKSVTKIFCFVDIITVCPLYPIPTPVLRLRLGNTGTDDGLDRLIPFPMKMFYTLQSISQHFCIPWNATIIHSHMWPKGPSSTAKLAQKELKLPVPYPLGNNALGHRCHCWIAEINLNTLSFLPFFSNLPYII